MQSSKAKSEEVESEVKTASSSSVGAALVGDQKVAVSGSIGGMVSFLVGTLGERLTTYLSGVDDPQVIGRWKASHEQPPEIAYQRLASAYEVTRRLVDAYGAGAAQSWFLGMNPLLDDESPAYVLRHGECPEDWALLLPAVQELIGAAR